MTFRLFIVKLVSLTAVIALVTALLDYFIPLLQSFQNFTWMTLGFFFVLTIVTGYIGFVALEKTPYGFVAGVNGIVLVKLMLSAGFIIAYVVIAKPGTPKFILPFFVFYIVYTIFEIRLLLLAEKKKSLDQKLNKNANG